MELNDDFLKFYSKIECDCDNVVIGGTMALKLHGLELHREPEDIDLIIYKPEKKQEKLLSILSHVTEKNNVKNKYVRRSYKIQLTSETTVDILVEHKKEMPKDLLCFVKPLDKQSAFFIPIQSPENIFKARQQYNNGQMLRRKDVIGSQKLKELNFNMF